MKGSNTYFKYRAELEEIQFLAYTVPNFIEYQKKMVATLKDKHNNGPNHPIFQEEKLFDVYGKKDYEGIMAKQLLFSLYAQFEILINELAEVVIIRRYELLEDIADINDLDLFGVLDKSSNKKQFIKAIIDKFINKFSNKAMKDKLFCIYNAIPTDLQNCIDEKKFDEIDYYYVVRNIFLHNNGVINQKAIKRASNYLREEDLGKKIRLDIEEFEKAFELLSGIACLFSKIIDNMPNR